MKEDIIKLLEKLNKIQNQALLPIEKDIKEYVEKILKYANIIFYYKEGKLIAFIAFYMNDVENNRAYLTMLAVDSKYQSQGLGKMLLENSISILRKNNFKIYELEVDKNNLNAKELYKKFGFVIVDETDSKYRMQMIIK